ncbi:uncharacterized protein LOC120850302 isoform X1 [Ixodes scapularis]|uniref:uncharacterized protein LOC115311139 isoform X2 n=1 Tax=Ixodes scapularis TaxID=6945 RepID=UPI001A9FE6AA|nr:uncharacterized protein LOC115311139 isoform X2 [Ixodes scapularis]XP_040354455.1 uncharacterized protein LOC120850302 isoform X1 [Ixodes scapularis]
MNDTHEKPFIIAKFPDEENGVALIHESWLDGDICYWPKDTGKIQSLVKNGEQPTSEWRRLRCIPIGWFASYDHARKRLPEAEELSDLYSEIEQPKRRRRRARRYSTDSDSDDSYQFAVSLPLPSPPASASPLHPKQRPDRNTELLNRSTLCGTQDRSHNQVTKARLDQFRRHKTARSESALQCRDPQASDSAMPSCSTAGSDFRAGTPHFSAATGLVPLQNEPQATRSDHVTPNFFKEILRLLHIIQFKLNEHALKLELLTTLVSNSNDENILVSGESFGPFNELATFLDFDASVASSEEKKKRLMVSWGKYGGSSGPDMTRRILVGLLSDDIAVQYSFKGGKGKRKFNELACWEIIKETVKAQGKLSGATDYDVEQTVKSWLAHSKERLDKAAKNFGVTSSPLAQYRSR